jgi:hypothetical protein
MNPVPEFLQPQWFFPLFAIFWLGIACLLSLLGGWHSLASRYRAEESEGEAGERFRFVSGSLGARFLPVSYNSCLFVTVNERGFGLSVLVLFRIFSPPLFIPWTEVTSVEPKRSLLVFPYSVISLGNRLPTISLRGAAGKRVQQVFAQVRARRVP